MSIWTNRSLALYCLWLIVLSLRNCRINVHSQKTLQTSISTIVEDLTHKLCRHWAINKFVCICIPELYGMWRLGFMISSKKLQDSISQKCSLVLFYSLGVVKCKLIQNLWDSGWSSVFAPVSGIYKKIIADLMDLCPSPNLYILFVANEWRMSPHQTQTIS